MKCYSLFSLYTLLATLAASTSLAQDLGATAISNPTPNQVNPPSIPGKSDSPPASPPSSPPSSKPDSHPPSTSKSDSPPPPPANTKSDSSNCNDDGVCSVGGATCLQLSRIGMCSGFQQQYMPQDISDWVNENLPNADWGKFPPKKFNTVNDFNEWFGNLTNKADIWNKKEDGCVTSKQRWWLTWLCTSMGKYYSDKKSPCGFSNVVCKSTMKERASLISQDLNDPNGDCTNISDENRKVGNNYVSLLSDLPYASVSSCVDGPTNEKWNPQCGWLSQVMACRQNCTELEQSVKSTCPSLIAADDEKKKRTPVPQAIGGSNSAPVGAIVGGIIGAIALVGVMYLARSRKMSNPPPPPPPPVDEKMEDSAKHNVIPSPVPMTPNFNQPGVFDPAAAPAVEQSIPPMASVVQVPTTVIEESRVVVPFVPSHSDEIYMNLGDHVGVQQKFEDGYAYGINYTTNQAGVFPLSCFVTEGANDVARSSSLHWSG